MRPRSSVQAVILYIEGEAGEWIPTRFEINSWVILTPGRRGGHAQDAIRHGGNSIEGAYKAKILQFRFSFNSNVVSEVKVQHAYMYRQLELDPQAPLPMGGANYLYLSEYVDWVDAKSLLGIITVVHADVGEPYRGGRSHRELLRDSLFFYNSFYYPRIGNQTHGRLEPIPLPNFDDLLWPLPDMATTESFRAKMRLDFITSMKPATGSQQTHLQWFMPVTVMVDLFSCAENIRRTSTFFVFRNVTRRLMSSLMDDGWDSKITIGADVIKCKVDWSSLVFRFHIGRSILYTNFQFNRQRLQPNNQWQHIDQTGPIDVVFITCEYGDGQTDIEVGRNWLLSNVREEITITLGTDCPADFRMWIVQDGQASTKVNQRNERNLTVVDVLPPKRIRILSR